jgi:hypothetical protein
VHRRWPALLLSLVFAFVLSAPALAQESGTPTADDEPEIDLLEYGAWGVATREYEQTGEDLDFTLFYTTSIAAFPDEETAEEAFPQIVEEMQALPQYQTLDEIEVDEIADEQIGHYGEFESNGYTFNVGILVVRNGAFLTMVGTVAFETLDNQEDLAELSTLLNENLDDASPVTGDDLADLLLDPDDLPGADAVDEPYKVSEERIRLPEE